MEEALRCRSPGVVTCAESVERHPFAQWTPVDSRVAVALRPPVVPDTRHVVHRVFPRLWGQSVMAVTQRRERIVFTHATVT